MAQLVDQFGFPINSGSAVRILDASQSTTSDRPAWATATDSILKQVTYQDWRTQLSASRRLWANYDVLKGATAQKAMHVVGRAWDPECLGEDQEWGEIAAAWLRDEWFNVCDTRGDIFDFKTGLFLDSICIDRCGEAVTLFTETDDGYPQIQSLGNHRIGIRSSGSTFVTEGTYKGLRIEHGVIFNKRGRAVAYRVLGSSPDKDQDISARDLVLRFDPEWQDQARGFSSYSGSINFIRDNFQSHQWEQKAQLIASSIGLIEYNESGEYDANDPANLLNTAGQGNAGTLNQQKFEGGLIRYFKSNGGGKLTSFLSERPGEAWDSFQDRVIRLALLGMNWPYSMCWKPENMNGTQERSEIEKARAAILDRQELLLPTARRKVGYAVSKAMKLKILPPYRGKDVAGFLKWDFSLPPLFSIDKGKDGKEWRENYKLGAENLNDYLRATGRKYEQHRERRKQEMRDLIADAKELAASEKIPFQTALDLLQQRSANPAPVAPETPEKEER